MSEHHVDLPYTDLPESKTWTLPHHCINRLQQASISEVVRLCKASHWADIVIRINGEYKVLQADWLKYLGNDTGAKHD